MAFNPKSLYFRTFLAGQKTDTVIMFTQSLLFPLFCLLPIVVIGKSQPDKPIAKQENDTIVYRLNDMGSTDQDANYIRQFFYETTA